MIRESKYHLKQHEVALLAFLILLLLTGGRWWAGGNDISRFSVCGSHFTRPELLPVPLLILPDSGGYDGQFFTRLAFAPFTREKTAYGITLDAPAYRQQRILYPLAAWMLAGGRSAAVPWSLVIVNFLAMLGIALTAARLAEHFGLNPAYGLLLMASSGFILSFGRNLAEPLAGFLVLASLYQVCKQRIFQASLLACAAVLTREPSLLTFAGVGLGLILAPTIPWPQKKSFHFLWLLLPLGVYLAWIVYLRRVWGSLPSANGPLFHPWPLLEFGRQLLLFPYREKPLACAVLFLYLLWYARLAVSVLYSFSAPNTAAGKSPELLIFRLAWSFWALFALFLPTCIWEDEWSFVRVLGEWSLLGWLCLFAARRPPRKDLIIFTVVMAAGSILRLWLRP